VPLRTIQPNFKIPDDYERLFMLFGEKDFRYIVIADREGIHTGEQGIASKKEESWCLDWMMEVMAHIRCDCDETFH
jgi:hypothetical protein